MTDFAQTAGSSSTEPVNSPPGEHAPNTPHSHGNTPAAWTCVGIMILGTLVCAAAFFVVSTWVFVAGLVIVVVGLVVGKLMAMAGYGSLPSYTVEEPFPTVFEGPTMTDGERNDHA